MQELELPSKATSKSKRQLHTARCNQRKKRASASNHLPPKASLLEGGQRGGYRKLQQHVINIKSMLNPLSAAWFHAKGGFSFSTAAQECKSWSCRAKPHPKARGSYTLPDATKGRKGHLHQIIFHFCLEPSRVVIDCTEELRTRPQHCL